jgi:hypothetical protein
MRLLIRLAAFCLSFALLSGVLLHDLASVNMSLDMASAVSVIDAEQDSRCPACAPDGATMTDCDMDCTAPIFLAAQASQSEPNTSKSTPFRIPSRFDLAGLDLGIDLSPPRSTSIS